MGIQLLAFDASVEPGSVALLAGSGAVFEYRAARDESSSQALLPAAQALLAVQGLRLADLDTIAFGCGPGSFTGLRVACGIVQGLAFGLRLPVIPVDSLATIALQDFDAAAMPEGGETLVLLDARMGEVYCARYRCEAGLPVRIAEAQVLPPAAVEMPVAGTRCAGNALLVYPELAACCSAAGLALNPQPTPTAAAVARLALAAHAAGKAIPAREATPVYVRDKVALTTRERLAAGGRA
jgi:tRNA threonylcarbamoyladenosine biosynthesis protein TsaB